MTTLLQEWLHNPVPSPEDAVEINLINKTLNGVCPRYVFTENLALLYLDMKKNDQITWEMILQGLRDTGPEAVWIETVVHSEIADIPETLMGGLVYQRGNAFYVMYVDSICGREGMPSSLKNVPIEGTAYFAGILKYDTDVNHVERKANFQISRLMLNKHKQSGRMNEIERSSEAQARVATNLIFALFLIQQPKVYTSQAVKPDDKLQKARAKKGKKPLPEYTIVNLTIGREETKRVYDANNETGAKRRYHYVMGHFRHLGDKIVWISAHYRGDASLGIVKREVHVTMQK